MNKPLSRSIMTLFCGLFAFASFGKEPKCEIRNWTRPPAEAIQVPITVGPVADAAKPDFIVFREIEVSAIFNKKEGFFEMKMGDVISILSDVTEDTMLPSLQTSKFIFECWFQK